MQRIGLMASGGEVVGNRSSSSSAGVAVELIRLATRWVLRLGSAGVVAALVVVATAWPAGMVYRPVFADTDECLRAQSRSGDVSFGGVVLLVDVGKDSRCGLVWDPGESPALYWAAWESP